MDTNRDKEIIKLRRDRWSAKRIADRLGLSAAQVYRDLDRLRNEGHDLPRTIGNGCHQRALLTPTGVKFGTMSDMLHELTAHELQAILRHQRRRETVARLFARLLREAYAQTASDIAA